MGYIINEKGMAIPEKVETITKDAFNPIDDTVIRWLGGGAAMINTRGEVILIDPLLEGFDMPLVFDSPLAIEDVSNVGAIMTTHIDNDHFSRDTMKDLKYVTRSYHSTQYCASEMRAAGLDGIGHDIGDSFHVGDVEIRLTPAKHNWQNEKAKWQFREWKEEDYCGFYLNTPDGTIWMPGDSRLLDEHLTYEEPDVILLDFSDDSWHIGFEGAVKLCNAYPNAILIPIHWGSVDAPDWATFNGNPGKLKEAIVNPDRLVVLNPGEPYKLTQ